MSIVAALYARTAVDDDLHPIAEQSARLRAYISAQGWSLADEHVFEDVGISGLVFERPGLAAMLDALHAGDFVRLVVEHPDRLSRVLSDRWLIENTAARMGCRVVYLAEAPAALPAFALPGRVASG